ncbi:hypothetical protein Tco_1509574 [Tanacetum coccineum]
MELHSLFQTAEQGIKKIDVPSTSAASVLTVGHDTKKRKTSHSNWKGKAAKVKSDRGTSKTERSKRVVTQGLKESRRLKHGELNLVMGNRKIIPMTRIGKYELMLKSEITILKTNTPYPSRKIRRIRACTHQRPQRNRAQYAVSREDHYAVLEIWNEYNILEDIKRGSGYHQKDRKPSQNDKTEHGMEKTVQNQGQKSKNAKVRVNTEESAVKPEPELKNTIECNLNPSDGPGKPNSIFMKTVKTKWALNHLQQPICVQLTKTVKTLKAQS